MNYVTQAELDALAATANARLLPRVNASIAAWWADSTSPLWAIFGAPNLYHKYLVGPPCARNSGWIPANPQPPYSFAAVDGSNILDSAATYGPDGAYSLTITADGDYNLTLGAHDVSLTVPPPDPLPAGWSAPPPFVFDQPTNNFWLASGTEVKFSGTASALVTATLARSNTNWLNELNRIRADALAWALSYAAGFDYFELNGTYRSGYGLRDSGPWIVGLNDLTTYPLPNHLAQRGALDGLVNGVGVFGGVGFIFDLADGGGLAIDGTMECGTPTNPNRFMAGGGLGSGYGGISSHDRPFNVVSDSAGVLTVVQAVPLTSAPADTSGFTLTATPSDGVTWSIGTMNDGTGRPAIIATVVRTITAGIMSQRLALSCPTGVHIAIDVVGASGEDYYTWNATLTAALKFVHASVEAATAAGALHPTAMIVRLDCPETDFNYHSLLTIVADGHPTLPVPVSTDFKFPVSRIYWQLNSPTINGLWVANTLPTPGINVFIDQDIPPYVGSLASVPDPNNQMQFIAVAGNGQTAGTTDNPYASTMRQLAPGAPAGGTLASVNPVKPSLTTRAAKWLVRRDTDFVPWDLGFNSAFGNSSATIYADYVVAQGALNYFNVAVPPNATGIKIRLMQPGTQVGWYGGGFQYGQPCAPLTILVRHDSYPTVTAYDFAKSDNTVTMDPDGLGTPCSLAAVVNNGFNFAVLNNHQVVSAVTVLDGGRSFLLNDVITLYGGTGRPCTLQVTGRSSTGEILPGGVSIVDPGDYLTPPDNPNNPVVLGGHGSGAQFGLTLSSLDVHYDCWVEIEGPGTPQRIYIPPCAECFSYNLDGTPGVYEQYGDLVFSSNPQSYLKPIPPSGYCLFSVRATRLPVDNGHGISVVPASGPALTVTLGQNILSGSTLTFTPLGTTLTIPADARDSGDVPVFIPVLGGNELAYQCSAAVQVEALANFQPLFWNQMYNAPAPYDDVQTASQPQATCFPYALSFVNRFDVTRTGWNFPRANAGGPVPSVVEFPLARALYTDLAALLGQVPAP